MESTIQLFNLALARLGGEQLPTVISSLEGDTVGTLCQNLLPHVLDMTLAAYEWGFALKKVFPALKSTEEGEEWAYRYAMPSDCVRLVAVSRLGETLEYVIEGDNLCCNLQGVRLLYVARVKDPRRWPPLFADALAWGLAGELASARLNDSQKQGWCYQMYETTVARACTQEHESIRPMRMPSAWTVARGNILQGGNVCRP